MIDLVDENCQVIHIARVECANPHPSRSNNGMNLLSHSNKIINLLYIIITLSVLHMAIWITRINLSSFFPLFCAQFVSFSLPFNSRLESFFSIWVEARWKTGKKNNDVTWKLCVYLVLSLNHLQLCRPMQRRAKWENESFSAESMSSRRNALNRSNNNEKCFVFFLVSFLSISNKRSSVGNAIR